MALLPRTQRRYEEILTDAYVFASHNLHRAGLSFADFVEDVAEPERTVQRALAHFDCTWHKILLEMRMEEAKWLLFHTDYSISVIAFKCGYKSHSLFTDVFKTHHDKTPGEYRDASRRHQ